MVSVMWLACGTYDEAEDWQSLLDLVRNSQMREYTPEHFRKEMQLRAQVWAGAVVRRKTPARQFFAELERAGMVLIVSD